MESTSPVLFVEIDNDEYKLIVGVIKENGNFKLIHSKKIKNDIHNNTYFKDNFSLKTLKDNIYTIEQNLNYVFKTVTLVINDLQCSVINLTGFKKLSGSQLSKEDVIYILNTLKSKLLENEKQKKILHIFNSDFFLDKKKFENLPIGLFGNFYSQELSFFLIEDNDYKNFKNTFNDCNLKVNKIISKKFLDGVKTIRNNHNLETFFKIEINKESSEIIFFENSSLKFFQRFEFGANTVISDISKIIALKKETVENILFNSDFSKNLENELIEERFFDNQNFKKIKKKLITDIAQARIQEIAEIILLENINVKNFLKKNPVIFLNINDSSNFKCFESIYKESFSKKSEKEIIIIKNLNIEETYESAYQLVQYGWKKEAVPIVQDKKSLIARFFDLFFN